MKILLALGTIVAANSVFADPPALPVGEFGKEVLMGCQLNQTSTPSTTIVRGTPDPDESDLYRFSTQLDGGGTIKALYTKGAQHISLIHTSDNKMITVDTPISWVGDDHSEEATHEEGKVEAKEEVKAENNEENKNEIKKERQGWWVSSPFNVYLLSKDPPHGTESGLSFNCFISDSKSNFDLFVEKVPEKK